MLAILYMIAFTAAGIDMGNRIFADRPPQIRIWLGAVLGLIAQIWLPALAAFFVGFGLAAQFIACGVFFVLWLAVFWRIRGPRRALEEADRSHLFSLGIVGLPMLALMLILFVNHVLVAKNGGLWVGQSTYGDLSLHLGIVTSIAKQGCWPPEYSILPGTRIGYPFLVDSYSSTLLLLGLPLRWAIIIPSLFITALCFGGFYFFLADVLPDRRRATLAWLLFFLTGGLGFLFFLNNATADGSLFSQIFSTYYQTPTNYPTLGLRWVNVLCDMILPQRTTMLGWAVLPAGLYLAWQGGVKGSRRDALMGGLVAGTMPMMHTHSFLALGVICAGWLLAYLGRQKDKKAYLLRWLLFLAPVLLLATPQLLYWTFDQSASQGFLRAQVGWVIGQDTSVWFWVKNAGLPMVVLLPALWSRWREHLPWYSGAAFLFVLCHFVIFQPNAYDNNKLLYVWYLFTAAVVADYLVMLWDRLRGFSGRTFLAVACAVVLFASAGLTIIREVKSGSDYELFTADELALADYIEQELPADALVLTADQHNNVVAVLTGRNIYVGTDTFLYYHGFSCADRHEQVESMYTDAQDAATMPAQLGIDYILVSNHERNRYGATDDMFDGLYEKVFSQGDVTLYAVMPMG